MLKYWFGISVLFLCACQQDTEPILTPVDLVYQEKVTERYKEIAGVKANLLSLDIYQFTDQSVMRPVVIYVHGGGWKSGDKENMKDHKIALYEANGYLLVSVNYRLSPNNFNENPNRVIYPKHNKDVSDAIQWIHQNIHQYGGDANNMVLMGFSAGGHIVSLTGTSDLFLPALGFPLNMLKGVVCIDTEGYDVSAKAIEGSALYINPFGRDPAVWFEASAINHVFPGKSYPDFFMAKRGSAKRIAAADAFIEKLTSAGAYVAQVNGSQYDHSGILAAIGADGETAVTEPLLKFLQNCFGE